MILHARKQEITNMSKPRASGDDPKFALKNAVNKQ